MFQFAESEKIYFLLLLIPLWGLFFYASHKRRKKLFLFANPRQLANLNRHYSYPKQYLRLILISLIIIFLTLTLMRPQGNPVSQPVTQKGRDLFFILDVSKSMLAEDLKPNRLERAKQLIHDVVDILKGDRVGLLVFAGTTALKSPLTLDYHYFKNILSRISVNDVNRGGTHIGDAIRLVTDQLFNDQDNSYRDIILITDGEDHKSFPLAAAQNAQAKKIRIHTVGLGSPDGAYIPLRQNNTLKILKHHNQTITTRLDEKTLNRIAEITGGIFVPVRTRQVDLAELYQNYIATAKQQEHETKTSKIWSELFQFFLGIAIALLIVETLLGEYKIRFQK